MSDGLRKKTRSTRESNCDCDRSMEASLLQTVYLQNDADLYQAIDGGRLVTLAFNAVGSQSRIGVHAALWKLRSMNAAIAKPICADGRS